jgi:hypothetical protein
MRLFRIIIIIIVIIIIVIIWNRDSSVGIVMGYGLAGRGSIPG